MVAGPIGVNDGFLQTFSFLLQVQETMKRPVKKTGLKRKALVVCLSGVWHPDLQRNCGPVSVVPVLRC